MDITRLCVIAGLIWALAGCVAGTDEALPTTGVHIYEAPKVVRLSAAAGKGIVQQSFIVAHSEGELVVKEHDAKLNVSLVSLSKTQTRVTLWSEPLRLQQSVGVLVLQLFGQNNEFAGASIAVEFDIYEAFDVYNAVLLRTHIRTSADQFWDDFDQQTLLKIIGDRAQWQIICGDERLHFSQVHGAGSAEVTVSFNEGATFVEPFTAIPVSVIDDNSGETLSIEVGVQAYSGVAVVDREITFELNPHGRAQDLVTEVKVMADASSKKAGLFTDWTIEYLPEFVTATPMSGNTREETTLTLSINVDHPSFSSFFKELRLDYDGLYGDRQYVPISIKVNTPLINETSSLTAFENSSGQVVFTMHHLEDRPFPTSLNVNIGDHLLVAENVEGSNRYLLDYPKLEASDFSFFIADSEAYQARSFRVLPSLTMAEHSLPVGEQGKLFVDSSAGLLISLNTVNHQITAWSTLGEKLSPVTCQIDGDVNDIAQVNGHIFAMTGEQVYRIGGNNGDCTATPIIAERYLINSSVENPDYQSFYHTESSVTFIKFPNEFLYQESNAEWPSEYVLTEALYNFDVGLGSTTLGYVEFDEWFQNQAQSPWVTSGNGLYVAGRPQGVRFERKNFPFSENNVNTTAGMFDFKGQYFLTADHQLFHLENGIYQRVATFENAQLSQISLSGEFIYTLTLESGSFLLDAFKQEGGAWVNYYNRRVEGENISELSTPLMAVAGDQKTLWIVVEGQLYTINAFSNVN